MLARIFILLELAGRVQDLVSQASSATGDAGLYNL
jgi:hypothetical protein